MTANSSPDSRPQTPDPRLAVVCDLAEENWPSMELVADKLIDGLAAINAPFRVERVQPPMRNRFTRVPGFGNQGLAFNADRLINRMRDYPRYLRSRARKFDLFHLTDHSYAHLVHELDPARTGVFCHDLDTFRCLLEPEVEPRPVWFRRMARRILEGLQKAAVVFHTTDNIRSQIEKFGLLDPAKLVKAPYGVAEIFQPFAPEPETLPDELSAIVERPFLLHVGSCIPRKRVEVLFRVMAELWPRFPQLKLLQVGGIFSERQKAEIDRLGIAGAVHQIPRLDQPAIAALYRRAALVLMPSEAEGFGLPVIEALACGAAVVASDIPVFREVGNDAVVYCPLGDLDSWASRLDELLQSPAAAPLLSRRLARASRYSWVNHARIIAETYEVKVIGN